MGRPRGYDLQVKIHVHVKTKKKTPYLRSMNLLSTGFLQLYVHLYSQEGPLVNMCKNKPRKNKLNIQYLQNVCFVTIKKGNFDDYYKDKK